MIRMIAATIVGCLMFFLNFNLAVAGFNVSEFELEGEFADMYKITYEGSKVFIEADLSAEECSFSHKNESKYYYSTVYADLIVLDYKQSSEYVVPRLWIDYCTDSKSINARIAEFTVGNKVYAFTLDTPDIQEYEHKAINEQILIKLGKNSFSFLSDWYDAAVNGQSIRVKLIGEHDSIEFDLPDLVTDSAGLMWGLFAAAGGFDTIDEVLETYVSISEIEVPKNSNLSMLQYHDKQNNAVFSIPKGWNMVEIEEGAEGAAKFEWKDARGKEAGNIVYISSDIWTELFSKHAELMEIYSRSDIDGIFSTADIAEMYGIDDSAVERVMMGDYEYYKANVLVVEKPVDFVNVVYINVVNGYSYLFQYTGTTQKLGDFEQMVKSTEHFRSL